MLPIWEEAKIKKNLLAFNLKATAEIKTYVALEVVIQRMSEVGRDLKTLSGPRRATESRLPWTMSRQHLKISKERDSTTSLSNLRHCSFIHMAQKCFLFFRWKFLCLSLSLLSLLLSLSKRAWLHLPCTLPSGICIHWDPLERPLLRAEQSQLAHPLLTGAVIQSLHHLHGPTLYSFQYVYVPLVMGAQNWTWWGHVASPMPSKREGSPPSTCLQYFA